MRTHQASQKKSSAKKAIAPTPNPLASRPFAVQPKLEEISRSQEPKGYESAMPEFAILNPEAGRSMPVQPKLAIGAPGDKYEQEADRVASQVVKQINSPDAAKSSQGQSIQRQEASVEELQAKPSISNLQRSPLSPKVQREAMPEEEDLQAKSILQRREAIAGGQASTDLESSINRARGSGQPLDRGLQRSMGQAMGADFSEVKVHTDAQSDQLNQTIQARAFTTGQDVFFRQGEYNPGSRGGQELIAHELTHVVQQHERNQLQRTRQPKNSGRSGISKPDEERYFNGTEEGKLFQFAPIKKMEGLGDEGTQSSDETNDKRAILFEAISTLDKVDNLTNKYLTDIRDDDKKYVGLSVVLNGKADEVQTQLETLKKKAEEITKSWKGPALTIIPAVWQGSSVPYLRLRHLAATNEGAKEMIKGLRKNSVVTWRRMGDDDMTFTSPNNENDFINQELSQAEGDTSKLNKMVTFGYNLTTEEIPTNQELVKKILKDVYEKEMELRWTLREAGVGVYPIEPNTFYLLNKEEDKVLEDWKSPEKEKGQAGQTKEGLKLYEAANKNKASGGILQKFSTSPLDTSAGKRNDQFVEYLQKKITEFKDIWARKGTETEMKQKELPPMQNSWQSDIGTMLSTMDQSYFNVKNVLNVAKAMAGGKEVEPETYTLIERTVATKVKEAATEVFRTIMKLSKPTPRK